MRRAAFILRIDDERTIAADDTEKADDRGLGSLRSLLFSSRFKVPAIFTSSARHFHPKLSTDARGYSQINVRELTQINTNFTSAFSARSAPFAVELARLPLPRRRRPLTSAKPIPLRAKHPSRRRSRSPYVERPLTLEEPGSHVP